MKYPVFFSFQNKIPLDHSMETKVLNGKLIIIKKDVMNNNFKKHMNKNRQNV